MRIETVPGWHNELRAAIEPRIEEHVVSPIRDDAVRGAPVDTGRMKSEIIWYRYDANSWRVHSLAPYTTAVEYNTRPHRIRARRARALHWVDEHGHRFAVEVMHPGTREQPFMRPALYQERAL